MVTKTKKSKIVCVSHKEDADGISSAALIKQAFGGETILVDYPGMMDDMEPLRNDESLKELYICDLGLNKKNECDFVEFLTQLRKRSVKIAYLDHHDLDKKIIKQLEKIKVKVVHDTNECASVQVYDTYKKKLNDHAAFVAACAAITDYMEDRPIGSKLLQIFDRQFALISATVLTYNIVGHQKEPDYLLYLVDELSESKYPHEIPNSYEFAQLQVEKLASIISKVKENMKLKKNLGYMEITDSGASGAVNFVLGLSGKDVGVAYKERVDYGVYAVSVRGSKQCKTHLGKLINKIATDVGGSGGGHGKACGASVPKDKITKFINAINTSLGK
ncbi:MAG: single-stranded DNA exonuclease RecJ [Candidatus Nitrosopelagicus sp.]|nr:MAG: single-stranded DNA exonuclease RecJ [Candidatus Nitrosopelagicus sp.]